MNNAYNTQKYTHIQVRHPKGFRKMQKYSLTNKTPQPCPLDCKSLLGSQIDKTDKSVKSDRLSLSGRDLTAIMQDIDLLLHSWEGPRHFTHLSTSVYMDAYARGNTLRYFMCVCFVCVSGFSALCACAELCSWNAQSTVHLLNNLACHEYFVSTWDPMCFLFVHTHTCTLTHCHLWSVGWVYQTVPRG